MRMKTLKHFAIVLFSVVMVTACSNDMDEDSDFSLDKYWVNIATVKNPELKNVFFLQLDDSTLLWTAASAFHNYKPTDGQRVIANYSLLADKRPTGMYSFDVRLNDVYEVLTKPIFNITPATEDSIGNDPVEVTNIWVGSKFLNVEFAYYGYDKIHFINMVKDDSKTYTDGKVHLEFRHNARGDANMYRRHGIVSFDISSLINTQVDSVPLVIHVKKPNQTELQQIPVTFRYKSQAVASAPRLSTERIHDYQQNPVE